MSFQEQEVDGFKCDISCADSSTGQQQGLFIGDHPDERGHIEDMSNQQEVNFEEAENNIVYVDSVSNMSMGSALNDNSLLYETERPTHLSATYTEPVVYIDEETRMFNESPGIHSPPDLISPAEVEHGEVSSPFSAMESDGMETGFDDANLSAPGEITGRPRGFFGASTPLECTTTPGASSSAGEDDYEESSGSRKKRRKTRREMQPLYKISHISSNFNPQFSTSQLPSPTSEACNDSSQFSPPLNMATGTDFKYSNQRSCMEMGKNFEAQSCSNCSTEADTANSAVGMSISRDSFFQSNAAEKRSDAAASEEVRKKSEKGSKFSSVGYTGNSNHSTNGARRRHFTHHRVSSASTESEPLLHKQYPSKADGLELCILSQPETQHRARYLTEGSRGPVKDSSQQGFPKVQLRGFNGPAVLQVFVGTDTGKVKPHGFYQACRVTGRNTSQCEELEIDGTKVIEIPFKPDDMILSIDCVGILKLRNTDVEARIGVRNQKRNQSVRLVFRVSVKKSSSQNKNQQTILQIASVRINCTQPLGQPEIVKKSIDRCSVEGGVEMFIIGKNFHKGTTVIYQDPEESDGSQWQAEGVVDKDTFHQTHMVVRVPAYHDKAITKPVNVQILVKYQERSCEPHSFTYIPSQKLSGKEAADTLQKSEAKLENKTPTQSSENPLLGMDVKPATGQTMDAALQPDLAVKSLLEGPIDKGFLLALFSKLVTSVERQSKQTVSQEEPSALAQKSDEAAVQSLLQAATTESTHEMKDMNDKKSSVIEKEQLVQIPKTEEIIEHPTAVFKLPEVQPTMMHVDDTVLQLPPSSTTYMKIKPELPCFSANPWTGSETNGNGDSRTIPVLNNAAQAHPGLLKPQTFFQEKPMDFGHSRYPTGSVASVPAAESSSISNDPVMMNQIVNDSAGHSQDGGNIVKPNLTFQMETQNQIVVNTASYSLDPRTCDTTHTETLSNLPSNDSKAIHHSDPPSFVSFTDKIIPDSSGFQTTLCKDSFNTGGLGNNLFELPQPFQGENLFFVSESKDAKGQNPMQASQISSSTVEQSIPAVANCVQEKTVFAHTMQTPTAVYIANPVMKKNCETGFSSESSLVQSTQENKEQTVHSLCTNVLDNTSIIIQPPTSITLIEDLPPTFPEKPMVTLVTTTPVFTQMDVTAVSTVSIASAPLSSASCEQREIKMNKHMFEYSTTTTNSNASSGLEHSPNFFAMDQLLQSIDGSESLATITGEDVQQQLQ